MKVGLAFVLDKTGYFALLSHPVPSVTVHLLV